MSENNPTPVSTSRYGMFMFMAAWAVIFALLIAYFSGMLDRQVNPNQSPESRLTQQGVEVVLKRNRMGHYVTTGKINDQEVVFLLDTGATNVSVGARLGARLGLVPGQTMIAQTANGQVRVARTMIDKLEIGDIVLYNIDASLNPGMDGNEILLGMSALKQLEWSQRGDTLTLKTF